MERKGFKSRQGVSLSRSLSLYFFLSLSHSLTLSHSHTLTLSHSHSLSVSGQEQSAAGVKVGVRWAAGCSAGLPQLSTFTGPESAGSPSSSATSAGTPAAAPRCVAARP